MIQISQLTTEQLPHALMLADARRDNFAFFLR